MYTIVQLVVIADNALAGVCYLCFIVTM